MVGEDGVDIAIVGCGLIGAGWAGLFAHAGHRVRAWDPSTAARERFVARVEYARRQLTELRGSDRSGRVEVCDTLAQAVAGAQWVQENAPEKLDVKLALYGEIEAGVDATTILASSTSSFVWSQLASAVTNPHRLVTAHPFNPPHLVPLVELFSPHAPTLDSAEQFFRSLGRIPVRMKRERVGHIGNRLASALWREAVSLVAEDVADVADVDRVLIHGPALRWSIIGTHMGYHLGGGDGGIEHYLRHLGPSQQQRWAALGTPTLDVAVCEKIVAGVRDATRGLSIAELEHARDEQMIRVLRSRATSSANPFFDFQENLVDVPAEITALVNRYFKGLYYGDTDLLRSVFHPQAQLFGDVRGAPYKNSLDGFLEAVAKRESPHQRGEEFQMEVVGVEVMNQIAYVKAHCPMLGFNYHDYLALVHENDRWLITNKLFTHMAD